MSEVISLPELMKQIKSIFQVDDKLRVYLYENKIKVIDYTPEIELPDGQKLDEFFGNLFTIYIDGNKITVIENSSISLITPANAEAIKFLTSLVGKEIEAYEQYPKLPTIKDLDYKEL